MKIPLAEMARRATNRRGKITMRPIEPTSAQAQALAGLYIAVLRIWQVGLHDQVLPAYSRTLAENRMVRDSVADIEVAILSIEQRILAAIFDFSSGWLSWANALQLWHMRKFIAQIKYATNVDLETMIGPADTRLTIAELLARNTALVRNVSDQVRGRVSDTVFRGLQANTPVREVAKQLSEVTHMARARSLRIASDQTVKLSAALDRERQAQMGMNSFEWRHSGKAHPREYHQARNRKVFAWDSEVGQKDPPGYAPFCGCKAMGVLEL